MISKNSRRGAKADFAVLLPRGHGGNPDQEVAILAKRQAIIWVANDPETGIGRCGESIRVNDGVVGEPECRRA